MPLSEEELKQLEQMERALVEEDPKLAHTLRGTTLRTSAKRRAVGAALVFAVGIAVLMAGAISQLWYVGIAGFVLMLVSATVGLGALRGGSAKSQESGGPEQASGFSVVQGGRGKSFGGGRGRSRGRGRNRSSRPFMERMEERWNRRREGGGF